MLEAGTAAILIFLSVIIFLRIYSVFHAYSKRVSADSNLRGRSSTSSLSSIDVILDGLEKPVRFSSQQLRVATNNLVDALGAGGFGAVYKGKLSDGLLVAVKVLNGSSEKKIEDQFLAEVTTIGRIHHFNLVQLYGFCFETDLRALVYEFMHNSSLDRLLFCKEMNVDWDILYNIAIGTGKGIAYLHDDCQQRIIHYDIKPENILLDIDFCPKVADFGLAKLCNREKTHMTLTVGRGTPGYAAPEMWMPFPVTHKCDVYSFGMLLFEILGRRRNLDVNHPDSQEWFPRWVWKKFEKGNLADVMIVCSIPEKDREKAVRMAMVALWCVQYLPESRPDMSAAVKMLEGSVDIPLPGNPFRHLMESPLPDVMAEVRGEACSFPPAVARMARNSSIISTSSTM